MSRHASYVAQAAPPFVWFEGHALCEVCILESY